MSRLLHLLKFEPGAWRYLLQADFGDPASSADGEGVDNDAACSASPVLSGLDLYKHSCTPLGHCFGNTLSCLTATVKELASHSRAAIATQSRALRMRRA